MGEELVPSLRQCLVARPVQGSCGFHLSRTQWDPYPWVSEVEAGSAADRAGLVVGDCVLEVNGEDVLGLRIGAVALRVYARADHVRLLLWNSGVEYNGAIWCAGSGPTPLSLQRLAKCLQHVVSLLECPVCLETIPPPASQCCNGHTLCSNCRALTDRCPVCRVPLGPRGRCLISDKLHALLTATFLKHNASKQKRSKERVGAVPQLVSRLAPRCPGLCHCPLAGCGGVLKAPDLLAHLSTHAHDGPLVQYSLRDRSAWLRLPVARLTTLTLPQGPTFLLHVTPHPAAPCLLLWLWAALDDTSGYRLRLEVPGGGEAQGAVFPLSWTQRQVLDRASDQCIVLNDDDFSSDCAEVKITILSKCDSTVV